MTPYIFIYFFNIFCISFFRIFIYCDSTINNNVNSSLHNNKPFEIFKGHEKKIIENDMNYGKKNIFKKGDENNTQNEETKENNENELTNLKNIDETKGKINHNQNILIEENELYGKKYNEEKESTHVDVRSNANIEEKKNKDKVKEGSEGENNGEIKGHNMKEEKEESKEQMRNENIEERDIEAKNEKISNECKNNTIGISNNSESTKTSIFLHKMEYMGILNRYNEDLKLYKKKLDINEKSDFYDYIKKRRNLISIDHKNEYLLKINYGKGYDFSLHNLYVVNEEKIAEKFYSNFTYLRDEDNSTLYNLSYFANLSKIDIDPTLFKEYYMKMEQCEGEYLPLKSSVIERICFVSNHIKKNPYINKVKITNKKPLLYRIFLKFIKAFKKLSVKQCIKNVEESNLLDVLLIFNDELVKESKKERNLGKCINNIITRHKEWYEVFNFLFSIMLGCSTHVKEHYFLNEEEKNEIYNKQKLIDLPIFKYLDKEKIDFYLPRNLETKINIDLYNDVSEPVPYKREIFRTWYACYLFVHKVYLLSKMWNLVKHWRATKYVPKPWYVQHVGSGLIPHIISLYNDKKKKYFYMRYLDENQFFMHFKRSKKYPLPDYDKNNYHLVENIIAFQGTSTPSMWFLNLIYKLSPYHILSKGKMHKGYIFIFEQAVKPYLDVLKESIQHEIKFSSKYTKENPYTLIFTGHSFGAAMAQLSAFYLSKFLDVKNNDSLKIYSITFGLPTFYDIQFSDDFRNSGAIINNINVNYDPVHVAMAIPEINNFYNPDEKNNLMIILNVEDLKHLNYDFGENIFYGDEIFNAKNHHNHIMTHFVTKYIFKKNIFLNLRELHISQTHYFFYYVFLTLLSGWANEADWGTYFMATYFVYDISTYSHNELMSKSKESYKKYKDFFMKKKLQNMKTESKNKE
ncbi:lipase, putative [Plasmodium relictum]|uniref:Lipase, putative n=1 Tax=Plasmodium relictum TaxID=85471 RepID=A0A1J1HDB1_PLARL|nr:lipase, putative [Plasmodium relictum]CRH03883.1 lipase, putative [Plasmodium relictum]